MEVYFYCNYANSKRGFLLTKLCADGLNTVSLFNSHDKGERIIDKFFSYDIFKVLWMDIQKDGFAYFNPGTVESFFGIRGLTGTISGRNGYLNIAFLAERDEAFALERLARGILSDIKAFSTRVFDVLSVGGKLGYELDAIGFEALLDYTANIVCNNFPVDIKRNSESPCDLFKFGVYVGSWESASREFMPDIPWKSKPKQALDENTFRNLFN